MRVAGAALALLICCGGSIADAASSSCFRRAEAVADQAIRYTTEIMVMSDTCRNETYDRFAQRNRPELVKFQDLLKQHFRRAGGNAQSKLDTFMTHLANEAALRTGTQDINQVCSVAVQFLATADTLSGDGFQQYAESQVKEHGRDYKFCKE
jgi:hypothetical protein